LDNYNCAVSSTCATAAISVSKNNNLYLCYSESNANLTLIKQKPSPFKIEKLTTNMITIRTLDNRLLSATEQGELIVKSTPVSLREVFTLEYEFVAKTTTNSINSYPSTEKQKKKRKQRHHHLSSNKKHQGQNSGSSSGSKLSNQNSQLLTSTLPSTSSLFSSNNDNMSLVSCSSTVSSTTESYASLLSIPTLRSNSSFPHSVFTSTSAQLQQQQMDLDLTKAQQQQQQSRNNFEVPYTPRRTTIRSTLARCISAIQNLFQVKLGSTPTQVHEQSMMDDAEIFYVMSLQQEINSICGETEFGVPQVIINHDVCTIEDF